MFASVRRNRPCAEPQDHGLAAADMTTYRLYISVRYIEMI
jgi:hypothetical protein